MSDRRKELERKRAMLDVMKEKTRQLKEEMKRDAEEAAVRAAAADRRQKELDQMVWEFQSSPSSLTPEQSNSASPEPSLPMNDTSMVTVSSTNPAATLTVVHMENINILPKKLDTYAKQTQTTVTGYELDILTYDDGHADDEESSLPHLDDGFHSKLPPGILPCGLPQLREVQPALTSLEAHATTAAAKPKQIRELTEEEKEMITDTEEFQHFLDRSACIMERALSETVDIFTDYSGADGDDGMEEKNNFRLSLNRNFYDLYWTRNRCVTSLDWSAQFPELLLASYHTNDSTLRDPEGTCLIWNTKFKKATPESIFHCQSPVITAKFARFHPNLILGGTYSGQVVVWDNRVQKRIPVQRTPLSEDAHLHSVNCLSVVGTQNAHNVISVSSDGRLCSWSLDMLSRPNETLQLRQGRDLAVTSMAFLPGDVNNFIVGCEEGTVYTGCRYGSKAGITETYEGHQGLLTGVSTHTAASSGNDDFSDLFLTSSFDWTVKLWSTRDTRSLHCFEGSGDYVYDVAWSPIHPALFATVDGSGRLDLWNLNQDTVLPSASVVVEGRPALNRVSWTTSGLHVTVGDDRGKIWVYDVGEKLAQPRHGDWAKFSYIVQDLKNNRTDEDFDNKRFLDSDLDMSRLRLTSLSSSPLR